MDAKFETDEAAQAAWFKALEFSLITKAAIVKNFGERFEDDPLLAVAPFYFERIGKCALQVGNLAMKKDSKNYEFHKMSWEYYKHFIEYGKHWKPFYYTTESIKKVKTLLNQFDKILEPLIKKQNVKKVWKKQH